eukprot:3130675-Rhodomonas_salina.1
MLSPREQQHTHAIPHGQPPRLNFFITATHFGQPARRPAAAPHACEQRENKAPYCYTFGQPRSAHRSNYLQPAGARPNRDRDPGPHAQCPFPHPRWLSPASSASLRPISLSLFLSVRSVLDPSLSLGALACAHSTWPRCPGAHSCKNRWLPSMAGIAHETGPPGMSGGVWGGGGPPMALAGCMVGDGGESAETAMR